MSEWNVRESLGLFWIYGGQLHSLVGADAAGDFPKVQRPARDVLRSLMRYALEQLEEQDKRDEVDSIVQRPPPYDF